METHIISIKLDVNLNLLAELKLPFKKILGCTDRYSKIKSFELCCCNRDDTESVWTKIIPLNIPPLTLEPEINFTLYKLNENLESQI